MDIPFFRSVIVVALTGLGSAHAQSIPDAGTLRQQIEHDQQQQIPLPQAPLQPSEQAAPKTPSGPVVTVREFRFTGNTLLSDAQLQAAVREYLGRDVNFDELQQAAQATASRYREAGWIVRSFLPRQDITDGVVVIQIEEARFGTTHLDGEPPKRISEATWRKTITAAQPEGAYLSASALDRALLILDDMPGVMASGSLASGQQPGQTDLLLKLADEPLFAGTIGADNTGARSTGNNRLTANININSPFGIGDRLLTNLIHADGNDYGRLAYTLPIGSDGLRIGANVSNLDYRLVPQQFAALDAKGTSSSWGMEASYPILRSRQKNIYLSSNLDRKQFDNQSNGTTTSQYDADTINIGLVGNQYDALVGGGASEASLFVTSGRVVLAGGSAPRTDRSEGDFSKLRWNLSRQQVISDGLSAYAAWNGQWSNKNLDSSEKFFLGGNYGVRAYPANEGGGSSGHIVNLELRQQIANGWLLTGFFDYGHVRQYADNVDTGGRSLTGTVANTLDYQGYGLSLGWNGPLGSVIKTTWARRLGSNPNPANNGKDQDGSLNKDRVWLSISVPFEFTPVAATPRATGMPPVAGAEQMPASASPVAAEIAASNQTPPENQALVLRSGGDALPVVPERHSPATASPTEAAIVAAVEEWQNAWMARDASRYLANYADDFRPEGGISRQHWQKMRRQRLLATGEITLKLADQRIKVDADTATVSFKQHYHSAGFSDAVQKTLTLKLVGNAWLIVSERQQASAAAEVKHHE